MEKHKALALLLCYFQVSCADHFDPPYKPPPPRRGKRNSIVEISASRFFIFFLA